jgi:hypothetical protein
MSDMESARRAILRYQPASNWVSISRDPIYRATVGFGFDVTRPEAPEMLRRVGLDPAAVRSGRMPVSDAQMDALLDMALEAATRTAHRRVPGFARMEPEQQWALLELIVWLGPDGAEGVFNELEWLSPPLTSEPSPWFDITPRSQATAPRQSRCRTIFESYGVVAELVSDDPDLLVDAEAMLPPGWQAADDQPSVQFGLWTDGVITLDGRRLDRSQKRARSLLKLGAAVRHHLATEAPGFTFVHAGAVDVGGCGIVIPGRSYSGKSTLVAELVRLGATYVSDEYAVVDPDGMVHPFAKPLSIRNSRHDPLGQLVPAPDALVADGPVRAGLIVLTSYAAGAQWRPTVRSRAAGAFALLQNTVSARLRPGAALSATSKLARGAVFLAGQRGEAADTAEALLEAALPRSAPSNTLVT